jgi:hypothetical protein
MDVNRHTEARSCNYCCSGKAIQITYSECASGALSIQQPECMSRNVLSYEACLALPYISHYLVLYKARFSRKRFMNKKRVSFSLQCLSETFLILRKNERDMIKNIYLSPHKVLVILARF